MTPDEVNLKALSHDQLVKYARSVKIKAEEAAKLVKEAQKELASRAVRSGTHVVGDAAVTMYRTSRFSDELAQANLPKTTYRKLLVSKADPTKAKEVLGDKTQAYLDCCEQGDWTVRIEAATTKNKVLAMDNKLDDPFSTDTSEDVA